MAKIRTRARAVDMLGRQQIATVQNAIAELFKNAYDAYAKRVQVDYLRGNGVDENGTLLVRDNGIGMTKDDFENKWLVLGTESKVNANREPGYIPEGMSPRKITGEKGIGRLAIALLGRQVVVFTRAERKDGLHDLVVCWIHWGLFEIPGVNLDDIEIPVKTFKGGELPELNAILALRDSFTSGIKNSTAYKMAPERCDKLIREIESLNPDLKALDAFFEKSSDGQGFSLSGEGRGTTFLIGSVNRVIPTELDAENSAQDYSFRRLLLGFVDPVFSPMITDFKVSFKVWNAGSFVGAEYLDDSMFFTKDELDNRTDHYFIGDVDEYGQFCGRCRIFDKEYPDLKIVWRNVKGKKTECGSFKVVFAALQGSKSESMVARKSQDDFNAINAKLGHIGGMYVFRDGIKILPYGINDFDWLEIEKRRNLGAGYYYFSYRRMFGAVLLSSQNNGALVEKAGREGLQKNVPYQQLRSIMMNLLDQVAAEYFRKDGRNTAVFEKQKKEYKKES
ncbi:MAG: ATP-binding protein, partial [Lentisphaerae bacterium]|nr:ATP-binding protein [Lentisphaerota bacterium]